ncbi:MAG: hypothetical protein ABI771_11250 [Betaproteobacteria bacterium]
MAQTQAAHGSALIPSRRQAGDFSSESGRSFSTSLDFVRGQNAVSGSAMRGTRIVE